MRARSAAARMIKARPDADDRAPADRFAALVQSEHFAETALACLNQGIREAMQETGRKDGPSGD